MKKWLISLCMLAAAWGAAAQDAAVRKIADMAVNDNRVMEHLDILCNRFGGRLIGSDAYDNAAEWTAHLLRKWGYEVELQEAGTVPVGFNRGPWFGRLLGENGMELHFATPSYTSGTHGVERGPVLIEPRTQEEFDRMKGALKGAWVLIGGLNSGWAIDRSARADARRQEIIERNAAIAAENREIALRNRRDGTSEPLKKSETEPALFYRQMVEAGVLGFIQASEVPIRALYDRTTVNDPESCFDNLPTVPDIKLDKNQYEVIYRMAQERRYFLLEFDIRNHFRMGPVKYHNVVATKRGSKYPDQYVLVSGHLDAYDVATGGVDCGTGVSVTLEAARMIAESGAAPKRTMVFCLFAGEEFGLLGAQAWVAAHTDELPRISNIFNRDGGPTPAVGITVPASLCDAYRKICLPVQELYPDYGFQVQALTPRKVPASFGGTDATVFATRGVPAVSLREGDVKGYNFSYGEIWHTERDTYTKSIPEYQRQAAAVTAIVSLGTANLDTVWPREEVYTAE